MMDLFEKTFENAGSRAGEGSLGNALFEPARAGRPSTRRLCPRYDLLVEVRQMEHLLTRARAALAAAEVADTVIDRFRSSLMAAGWAGVGLVVARSGREGNAALIWRSVPRWAPEFAEWAACFDQATAKLQAAVQRRYSLSAREADDLLRDAHTFVELVRRRLPVVAEERGTA